MGYESTFFCGDFIVCQNINEVPSKSLLKTNPNESLFLHTYKFSICKVIPKFKIVHIWLPEHFDLKSN